jgi:hypothetical protein
VVDDNLYLVCNVPSGENCRREMFMMEFNLKELMIEDNLYGTLPVHGKRTYIRELRPRFTTKLFLKFDQDQDQKNWMPLIMNNEIYFVYSINPHIIVKYIGPSRTAEFYDPSNTIKIKPSCVKIAETFNENLPSNLRGGGQIVKVTKWNPTFDPKLRKEPLKYEDEDLYLGVVHTRDSTYEYSTYFYAFEIEYPFRVKYLTRPFVFGEKGHHSKRIQFASGLAKIVKDDIGYLYVTYGEDDCTGKLCILSEESVLHSLHPIEF